MTEKNYLFLSFYGKSIFSLWQDYQTRSAIKDADGLSPMLELLKSEFAVIQKLSLLALDRASQDGKINCCKSKESYEEERLNRDGKKCHQ